MQNASFFFFELDTTEASVLSLSTLNDCDKAIVSEESGCGMLSFIAKVLPSVSIHVLPFPLLIEFYLDVVQSSTIPHVAAIAVGSLMCVAPCKYLNNIRHWSLTLSSI